MTKLIRAFVILSALATLNFIYSVMISLYFGLNIVRETSIMTLAFLIPLGLIPLINVGIRKKA